MQSKYTKYTRFICMTCKTKILYLGIKSPSRMRCTAHFGTFTKKDTFFGSSDGYCLGTLIKEGIVELED